MHNSEARCAQKIRFTQPGLQVRVGRRRKAVEDLSPGPSPCHFYINEGITLRKPPRASPRIAQQQPASARDIANSARRRGRRTSAAVRHRKAQPESVGHSSAGGGEWSIWRCVRPSVADSRSTWSERPVGRRRSGPTHNKQQHPGAPPAGDNTHSDAEVPSKRRPTDRAPSAAPGPSPTSPRQRPHRPSQGKGQGRAHHELPPPPPQ